MSRGPGPKGTTAPRLRHFGDQGRPRVGDSFQPLDKGRAVQGRKSSRHSAVLGFGLGLVAVMAPSPAGAATQIGQTFQSMNVNCDGPVTFLQSRSPDDQYAAPFAGVLTSWSVRAGPSPPQRKFKVARPVGGDNFTIVGESSLKTLLANTLNTFPVRIPVH